MLRSVSRSAPRAQPLVPPRATKRAAKSGAGAALLRQVLAGLGFAGVLAAAVVVISRTSPEPGSRSASVAVAPAARQPAPPREAAAAAPTTVATALPTAPSASVKRPESLPLPPPAADPVEAAASAPAAAPVPPEPAPSAVATPAPVAPPAEAPRPGTLGEAVARGAIVAGARTPTDCLPAALRTVLTDLGARFGDVAVVATTQSQTGNHSGGSVRHNLHLACKAVDFKVKAPVREVVAYLRTRPEVAGINTYRNNGVIHIDLNERAQVARRTPRPATAVE